MTARRLIVVYVLAFAIGTASHAADIARGGWLPYRQYSLGLNIFWTGLTLFDPLAIALLIYRRRAGLCLAILIITLDIAVNLSVGFREYHQSGRFTFWGVYTQVPFALFVWLTAPLLWADQNGPPVIRETPVGR
jgi:hypothetical protein